MTNLSAPVSLQPAEHLYSLRELMETFNLYWCGFLREHTLSYLDEIEKKRQLAASGKIPATLDAAKLEELLDWLGQVEHFCAQRGWSSAEHSIHDSRFDHETAMYELIQDADYSGMATIFRGCLKALDRELEDRLFLYVPSEDAELYKNPLDVFVKVVAAFPSTSTDAIEAGRCYALGRYTACVFHCMGILQYGLFALADEMQVNLNVSLQMAEWCKIINNIEGKIKDLRNEPKGEAKDGKLAFYSECGVQFRYFKDAWRNHVAHLRNEYDKDQAHSVLIHTREFMEHLSTRVTEKQIPEIDMGGTE